jgi:hypothetical protein
MAPDTRSHNLPSILYVCEKEQNNFGLGHLKYTEKKQDLHGMFSMVEYHISAASKLAHLINLIIIMYIKVI